MTMEQQTALIGDNMPPEDADPIGDRLRNDHADLTDRMNELPDAAKRMPETAKDDAAAGKVGARVTPVPAARDRHCQAPCTLLTLAASG